MSPIMILRSLRRLQPGRMLDIGAGGCHVARAFAELGYSVDAVDPHMPPDAERRSN